jgi:truncated hemoglobin YjbI
MSSLYERLGGEAAVNVAVDKFYVRVLADDRINHFFENLDMVAQANKQKAFLTMVFGGPHTYTGRDMRVSHAHLALTEEHYNAVMENLSNTLRDMGVGETDIQEVAALAGTVKDDILNR